MPDPSHTDHLPTLPPSDRTSPFQEPLPLPPGQAGRRFGDYELLAEVARGGMGVVYRARQVSLDRVVALKMILAGQLASDAEVERFRLEARTAAGLQHAHIVAIHEVGEVDGQHFFSMDFVEGHSLADLVRDNPLPPAQAIRYVHLVATAIHFAHEHGVLHRDLKPSNVLVDRFDTPRVTDFGLAKQTRGDGGLTASGAVLGTPGYMPPEQASGQRGKVGPASDVYSLGAILYELLTGRPPFRAATPLDTLLQVLSDEPAPPRLLNPAISRDLETVILKCLAKNPAARYTSAQELAGDLAAIQEGRPIRARRPGLVERAGRWLGRNRGRAALAGFSATAAVLLAVAALVGVAQYREWQRGSLYLANEGQVLTGELLDDAGGRVGSRFTVPTEAPLSLAAGSYRLRLRGRGFLEETFPLQIERGKELAFEVSLAEQRLWQPIAVPKSYECVRMGQGHDVLSLSATGARRLDGSTGKALWSADLGEKAHPALAGFRWDWDMSSGASGRNETDRRPRLLQPAPDLDRDGTPDLVWGSRRQAAVLALSGKDGKVLWCFQAPVPKFADERIAQMPRASTGTVLGLAELPDVDGDGVPDLVGTFALQQAAGGTERRWVEALSGRTGKSLWQYDLGPAWFTSPDGTVPAAALWHNLQGIASSSTVGIFSTPNLLYVDSRYILSAGGVPVPYPAEVVRVDGRPVVVVAAGTRLVGLDPCTGRPAWPAHPLGFWPLRPPQVADLDGDGRPDMLLLGSGSLGGKQEEERLRLVAFALTTRKQLWEAPFRGAWRWSWYEEPLTWPVVADLDGDGKAGVVVPVGDFEERPTHRLADTKWSGVQVLDGATGAIRWQRKLSRSRRWSQGQLQQVDRIVVGPSPTGEGQAVFTAVLDGDFLRGRSSSPLDKDPQRPVLLVDALAGSDGHSLWWARQRVTSGKLNSHPKPTVGPLGWWVAGKDGWPQLVVPYVPGPPSNESGRHTVYFVSAGTGKVEQVGTDHRELRIVDLDGDGLPDLLGYRPASADGFDQGGRLESIRGRSPEVWRRLGGTWQLAADQGGDGIPDLVTAPASDVRRPDDRARGAMKERERDPSEEAGGDPGQKKPVSATISGRTGQLRWQSEISPWQPQHPLAQTPYTHLHPVNAGDLLLVTRASNTFHTDLKGFSPLLAVSRRTGKLLWEADVRTQLWYGPHLLECRGLRGQGPRDLLFVSAMDDGRERPEHAGLVSNEWQDWLVVLSADDGTVRWKQPLCGTGHGSSSLKRGAFSCVLADLDGDGVQDVIVEAGAPNADGEVHAFSGKDGKLLWKWKPPPRKAQPGAWNWRRRPTLAAGDLDGTGAPVVVVLHTIFVPGERGVEWPHAAVVALDGRTGRPRWSWREPVDQQYNTEVRSRVSPLVVHLGGKRRGVCVWTWQREKRGQVILLDHRGKELRRHAVRFRLDGDGWRIYRDDPQNTYPSYYSGLFRVWAVDLDGDGRDELVFFTHDHLRVMDGGLDRVRWEWPLPAQECGLLGVRPASAGGPPLLAVRAGSRVVFLGDSPKPVWTCSGSGKPLGVAWVKDGPPLVYFDQDNEVTVCRVAQADAAGASGDTAPLEPPGEDPRFVVPLPWRSLNLAPPLLSTPLGLAAALLGLAVAVLVLPAALVAWAVGRRAWWLCLLPLVWLALCWGAACLLYRVRVEDDALVLLFESGKVGFARWIGLRLVLLALAGLPAVGFLAAAFTWLRRGKWGKLLLLLAGSAVLAALIGWAWLSSSARSLDPELRYSLKGWYDIWPAGVWVTGGLILAGVVVVRVVRLGRAAVRWLVHLRGRRAVQSAPAGGAGPAG
jgi:outer membrane protein assembly factor BamB